MILLTKVVLNADLNLGDGHDMVIRGNLAKSVSSYKHSGLELINSPSGEVQNSAESITDDLTNDLSGNARLTWRKRISDSGRSLIVEAAVMAQDADEARNLSTALLLHMSEDELLREDILQLQERASSTVRHRQQLKLLQPLRSGRNLSVWLEHSALRRSNEKAFFDLASNQYQAIEGHSDGLTDNLQTLRSGLTLDFRSSDNSFWISGNFVVKHSKRNGAFTNRDATVSSRYTHILPVILSTWEVSNSGSWDFFYQTSTREPSVRQLQPYVDNINPLRIYVGNPALTPEYRHMLSLTHTHYRSYSGLTLSADVGTNLTRNSIIRERTVDSSLRQHVTEVNHNGAWSADAGFQIGMPFRLIGLEWTIRNRSYIDKSSEIINSIENRRQWLRHTLGLDLDYFRGDVLEITVDGRLTWNKTRYSIDEAFNQRYINGRVTSTMSWFIGGQWLIDTSLHYRIFDQDLFYDRQNIALIHLAISRIMLAGRGNLKIELNDMLNHNRDISIVNGSTFIQESRVESLGRFLMLKFTYKPKIM